MVSPMQIIKHIPLVVALSLLVGCATTFRPWKLSEIEEGMEKAHVVKVLGEPDSVEAKDDGEELLYYSYHENYNPAPADADLRAADANRAFQEQQLERSLREYKYVVTLVDGKVQAYKEIQN